ncbi:MAG: protein translocase subunit SecF [Candidatus Limnocylindrales bacterium]|jgi:preprotein translocase SecF subunit
MFDLVGKRNWFFLLSGLIVVPGLIFILLTPLTNGAAGLKFSIDYTGGTEWQLRFAGPQPSQSAIQAVLVAQGLPGSQVQESSNGYITIRTKPIGLLPAAPAPTPVPVASLASRSPAPSSSARASAPASPEASTAATASASASPASSGAATTGHSPAPSGSPPGSAAAATHPAPSPSAAAIPVPTEGKIGELATALQAKFGPIAEILEQTTVGPIISSQLTQQAILLVILGSLGILLWVSVRFQDVKFGVSAIAALLHDVIVVVGTFAILGTLFGVQINSLFVTAMLTVIGFSVHDTIVVFDRIRENRARHAGEPFDAIVNHSILQTLGRSISTSMTVVIVLTALLLIGADTIREFVLALLIGIISGTYSSIFNASMILVVWHQWEDRRRQQTLALARATR